MSFAVSNVEPLLDDFVRSRQHIRRNREPQIVSGLEVDDQIVSYRLIDGQVGGIGTLQNLVHIVGCAAGQVCYIYRKAHQPTCLDEVGSVVHRWQPVLSREVDNL